LLFAATTAATHRSVRRIEIVQNYFPLEEIVFLERIDKMIHDLISSKFICPNIGKELAPYFCRLPEGH